MSRECVVLLICTVVAGINSVSAALAQDNVEQRAFDAQRLIELTRVSSLSISPDRSMVAYFETRPDVSNNGYFGTWKVVYSEGLPGLVSQSTVEAIEPNVGPRGFRSGEVRPPARAKWSSDSKSIAFTVQKGGEAVLFLHNVGGNTTHAVQTEDKGIVDFCWGDDPNEITFKTVALSQFEHSRMLDEERPRGFLVDERFMPSHSISPRRLPGQSRIWSTVKLDSGEKRQSEGCPPSRALRTALANPGILAHAKHISISEASGDLAWTEPTSLLPDGNVALSPPLTLKALISSDHQILRQCKGTECTGRIVNVWFDESGRKVIFGRRAGPNLTEFAYYVWDLTLGSVTVLFDRQDVWITDCVLSAARLICIHETPLKPSRIVGIDIDTRELEVLADPNPDFQVSDAVEVRRIEWGGDWGHWGRKTFGHLVLPKSPSFMGPYPLVIVQYYSQGFLRGGVGDEYPILLLAAHGFAVFRVERPIPWVALSSVSDTKDLERLVTFGDQGLSDWDAGLASLENGLELVIETGIVNEGRVGITGLSDGAVKALHGLVKSPTRYAVAALSSTAWDPLVYFVTDDKFRTQLKNMGFEYPLSADPANWSSVSPSMNANKIRAPILFHLADRELVKASQMLASLKEFDKPFDAFVFEDELHVKWQPVHRYNIYRRNLQWFQFWLQGIESDDPVDPEQYARWRKMRVKHCYALKSDSQDNLPTYCETE